MFLIKTVFDQSVSSIEVFFLNHSPFYSKESFSIKMYFIKVFLFNQRLSLRPKTFWIKPFLNQSLVYSSFCFFFQVFFLMKVLLIKGVLLNQRFFGLLSKVFFNNNVVFNQNLVFNQTQFVKIEPF